MTVSSLTHLECTRSGEHYAPTTLQSVSSSGAPLFARYDLARAARSMTRDALSARPFDVWRYREVLPVTGDDAVVTLGEGGTPLLPVLRRELENVFVKDESQNPTASFKSRGMTAAVSMARALGATSLAVPSAGNAGGALAAYAARAGVSAHVVVPRDAPPEMVREAERYGAAVRYVDGLIGDAARVVAEACEQHGWFDLATLKEPYRVEGKKTLGYELYEQLGGRLPDVILYPTGGGTGLIGMWKAFDEMETLGWIDETRPRMVSVQSTGCSPLERAMAEGEDECEPWQNAQTRVPGLRVPKALGDFLILRALRASGGRAVSVDDEASFSKARELTAREGISTCPEGGACFAALDALHRDGFIDAADVVVVFNTASGAKYTS